MAGRIALPKLRSRAKPVGTRALRGVTGTLRPPTDLSQPGPVPAWFHQLNGGVGPTTEWAVYWALLQLGKKPNVDFLYQSPFSGGRTQAGGQVFDFLILNPPGIAINPVGLFWHEQRGGARLAKDRIQREAAAVAGVTTIYIDEDDLARDPKFYVTEALRGIDHSRIAKGFG
ncbi:MAG: hypothetical protein HYX52_05675 [Chloroflexi bacterium]|nr:hypothetical protein [Chloroflexota bacterium]